jgi:hypothetical protein
MSYGSGIRDPEKTYPGSRGQKGTGSRIPDPDPQHWKKLIFVSILKATDEKIRIRIPPIRNPVCGSKYLDPSQNTTDSEHRSYILIIL